MRILVVDDEPMVRSSIARMINSLGDTYSASEAGDGEDALVLVNEHPFDMIITDIRMPAVDGLQLADTLQHTHPHIRVVLLSGYAEFDYAISALHNGVHEYLLKPASKERLLAIITKVDEELKQERAQQQIGRIRENSVLEKRIQDLLYELPIPHVDLALFPHHQSIAVFTMTAAIETLQLPSIRFAMKNVLEDVLGQAGIAIVIVEERYVSSVLFITEEAIDQSGCEQLSQEVKRTLNRLFHIELEISCATGIESLGELSLLYIECLRKLGVHTWTEKRTSKEPSDAQHRLIRSALAWIEEEYAEDLTLSSIANRLYINPNYLSTLFKNETGMTFTQHLTRIRIDKTKQLLQETHLKIYEICDRVGYSDQAYFSKLFKASVGTTPYEYREQTSEN
ncbi:MAG: response regulator [Paenibacillaceae bacterium]